MYPYINVLGKLVPTYGICMIAGFMLAALFTAIKAKKKGIAVENVIIIAAFVVGFSLLFGKLFYIFVTYPLPQIGMWISRLDFAFIVNSGIVFYGGFAGGVLGAFVGSKVSGTALSELEYALVPAIPLGHAIGRIGCLLAGCCYGIHYDGFFAVSYSKYSVHGLNPADSFFPVQLLEAFCDILIFVFLLWYAKKAKKRYDLFFGYALMYAVMRFFTEMLRGDTVRGIHAGISTSQWISILLVAAFIIRTILHKYKEKSFC